MSGQRNNQRFIEYMPDGVVLDRPGAELGDDVYTGATNFVFKEGAAVAAAGYSPMVPTIAFRPYAIGSVRSPNTYFWIFAGEDGVGITDGTNEFDLTPVGGVNGGVGDWTISNVNNLPMLCGGPVDPPWYWDQATGNPIQPLPNFPAGSTAGFIRTFKNFALAGDITESGTNFENKIIWSDPVEPGQVPSIWNALPDNLAGDNILASTEGALIDGVALRDQFLLFKTHSTYSMRLTGGVGVFQFAKLFPSIGILSRNCALEYKALVYMFTDGDIVVTDGYSVQSIADQIVRKTIFSELDADNFKAAFVQIWREEDQLLFAYPTVGSLYCDKAAVYNTLTKVWGFRAMPNVAHAENGLEVGGTAVFTWDTLPYATWNAWAGGVWVTSNVRSIGDSLIMGQVNAADGELQSLGKIAAASPELHTNILQKTTMDMGERNRFKIINEVWLKITGYRADIAVSVRLGTQIKESDPISWGVYAPYDDAVREKIDVFATGRFISIEIRTIEVGDQRMRIEGYAFRYRMGGRF